MGGHIAGAAIDDENIRAAVNKVRHHGAAPTCGVLGDTELFDCFAAYRVAAQQLAGVPAAAWPLPNHAGAVDPVVRTAIWVVLPSGTARADDSAMVRANGNSFATACPAGSARPNF